MGRQVVNAVIYTAAGLVLLAGGAIGGLVALLWGVEVVLAAHSPESVGSYRAIRDATVGGWHEIQWVGLLGGGAFVLALAYDFGRSVFDGRD